MEYLSYLSFWQWIGILLSLWVLWDLFTGHVYSYRSIYRSEEPGYYWIMMLIWAAIAAWCLFGMDPLLSA